jgi:hypothetical protein
MRKNVITSGLLVIVATGILFFSSCGGSVTPSLSEQQKAAKTLAEGSPWGGSGKVEVVDVPTGVDPSGLAELALVFGASGDPEWEPTSFDASGADEFLSSSNSTWKWGGLGTAIITLENASSTELTGVDIIEQIITVSFEINTGGGANARMVGLDGTYTVKLQRNE